MSIEKFILKPLHNKRNGISLGYILSTMCSSNNELEGISKIFYIANIIDYNTLKSKITPDLLLQKIFKVTKEKNKIKKGDLRNIIGLEDRTTSNKHLDPILIQLGLVYNILDKPRRTFTLKETYSILKLWQGDDKWGRMEAYTKGEAAKLFTNGNHNNLEEEITNGIRTFDENKNKDYLNSGEVKKLASNIFKNDNEKHKEFLEDDFDSNYLIFMFYLFVFTSIKFNKTNNKTSTKGIIKEITETKVLLN
jgi:hypothetical protein